jgi:hypothetical protein
MFSHEISQLGEVRISESPLGKVEIREVHSPTTKNKSYIYSPLNRRSIEMEKSNSPNRAFHEETPLKVYEIRERRKIEASDHAAGIYQSRNMNNHQGEVITDAQGRHVSMDIDRRGGVKRGLGNINEYSTHMHISELLKKKYFKNSG